MIITFLGFILPLALEYTPNYKGLVFVSFIIIVMLLIASFICALNVQWRMKYKQFLTPYEFYEEVSNNYQEYSTSKFYEKKISGYGDITKTEISNNNKRALLIMICHVLVLIAIALIIISSLTIIGLELS